MGARVRLGLDRRVDCFLVGLLLILSLQFLLVHAFFVPVKDFWFNVRGLFGIYPWNSPQVSTLINEDLGVVDSSGSNDILGLEVQGAWHVELILFGFCLLRCGVRLGSFFIARRRLNALIMIETIPIFFFVQILRGLPRATPLDIRMRSLLLGLLNSWLVEAVLLLGIVHLLVLKKWNVLDKAVLLIVP